MVQKKDYFIGALLGVFAGILTLRIFSFLEIGFKFQELFFLLGVPALWASGVWLGGFLGKWLPFFNQFGKFAAVGFLSTAIDFSILNTVSLATGVTAGLIVGWVNIPGFLIATINGYLWNKFWVFKKKGEIFGDFLKFFAVTILGLFINSLIIIILTTFVGIPCSVVSCPSQTELIRWLNISKVVATAVALVWNFVGYKFIAFKKHV